jgi:DNA-binding response OmpR family regulator
MAKTKVLVIEDDRALAEVLSYNLKASGYEVLVATDGQDGLLQAQIKSPDIVILDLMLPVIDGLDVCRRLRADASTKELLIVMLTAKAEESDELIGFSLGADDYVTKPFSGDELLARLRAALRRVRPTTDPVIEIDDLRIDLDKRLVTMKGRAVSLTPIEYDLLRLLAENEGKLMTHPTILREIWGPAYREESNYLHVYVSHLRRKIEPDPARPRYIHNQPGVGYRLVNPAERS